MPLPTIGKRESKKDFIGRCMSNSVTNKEFPNPEQRIAICNSIWDKKRTAKLSQELENMSK